MYSYIGEEMTPALKLAKECGIRDNIHDDAAMDYISNTRLETFYRRAQAQALREAATWFAPAGLYDAGRVKEHLRRMADELEAQK
jgi:hypothetical protein